MGITKDNTQLLKNKMHRLMQSLLVVPSYIELDSST